MLCASLDQNNFLVVSMTPPADLTTCQVLVFTGSEKAVLDLFLVGGFDSEVVTLAFTGSLLLFAVGLGVGAVVSMTRKASRF